MRVSFVESVVDLNLIFTLLHVIEYEKVNLELVNLLLIHLILLIKSSMQLCVVLEITHTRVVPLRIHPWRGTGGLTVE